MPYTSTQPFTNSIYRGLEAYGTPRGFGEHDSAGNGASSSTMRKPTAGCGVRSCKGGRGG
eukprot:6197293-Pleurochrysis_carterae.AAC.8